VSPGPDDQRPARRSVRVRTVVFGLVMMAVSVVAQVGLLTSVRIDGGVVALTLLIGAGAALLLGGLSAAIRDVRRGGTRYS
jgi:predicted phage tail protein